MLVKVFDEFQSSSYSQKSAGHYNAKILKELDVIIYWSQSTAKNKFSGYIWNSSGKIKRQKKFPQRTGVVSFRKLRVITNDAM